MGIALRQLVELGLHFGLALRVDEAAGGVAVIGLNVRETFGLGQSASHGGGTTPSGHVGDH